MGLPAKLKDMIQHVGGDSYAGVIGEIQLPKLAEKVQAWRGGGMLAEVDIGMGLEKLEMECKYGGLTRGIMRQFGVFGVAGVQCRFNGAYQEDVTGGVLAAELVTRSKMVELDPGSAKVGDNTEWTAKHTVSYLRWSINGKVEVEIDVINNILFIDGTDRMAPIRAALLQ